MNYIRKTDFNFKTAQTILKFPEQSFHWYQLTDFKTVQVSEKDLV